MPPLSFSEGFAIAAGLVQLFVAAVFMRFRHGRPEWGLGWWAVAFAAAGVLNTAAPVLLATMHGPFGTTLHVVTLALGLSTMGALVAGGRLYTGHAKPGPWVSFALTWLAYLGLIAAREVWPSHENLLANAVTGLFFAYLALLSLGAMRREPGAGHGMAATMLCFYIPMVAGAYAMGLDQVDLRYWSAVPFALAGLGVMSATMGRMRAHLRDLNESLEQRVTERTRELRERSSVAKPRAIRAEDRLTGRDPHDHAEDQVPEPRAEHGVAHVPEVRAEVARSEQPEPSDHVERSIEERDGRHGRDQHRQEDHVRPRRARAPEAAHRVAEGDAVDGERRDENAHRLRFSRRN